MRLVPSQPQKPAAVTARQAPTAEALMERIGRGDKLAMQTRPLEVLPNADTRLGVTALRFSITPHDLAPGPYQCQVSVVDPLTSKATFWRAPVLVVP